LILRFLDLNLFLLVFLVVLARTQVGQVCQVCPVWTFCLLKKISYYFLRLWKNYYYFLFSCFEDCIRNLCFVVSVYQQRFLKKCFLNLKNFRLT
jgi:hypothetical protein